MLIEQTLEKLTAMKLGAMAEAVQQQLGSDEATALSFEDRLGVLVDTEWTAREQRKLTRRLRAAKLRYAASLEAVDFTHPRRLKRQQVVSLGSGAWIADRHNLLIIGPTGIGKSFLASAFVERACRQGFSARYVRMPRLLHEVAVGRGDGSYTRLLTRLAKLDLPLFNMARIRSRLTGIGVHDRPEYAPAMDGPFLYTREPPSPTRC